jgi:hypothetical protein
VDGDRLEIRHTRPVAVRELTMLDGPARLAYQALDAGATVGAVEAELRRALGDDAPKQAQIMGWLKGWLAGWLADRLVMREGPRYLSLATDLSQRVQLPTSASWPSWRPIPGHVPCKHPRDMASPRGSSTCQRPCATVRS